MRTGRVSFVSAVVLFVFTTCVGTAAGALVPVLTAHQPHPEAPGYYLSVYEVFFVKSSPTETVVPQDFATIYDYEGELYGFSPSYHQLQGHYLGLTAPGTTPTDSPDLPNLSAVFLGDAVYQDGSLIERFWLVTTAPYLRGGVYTSSTSGGAHSHTGFVSIPSMTVPEPGALTLPAAGVVWALARRKRHNN